MNDKNEEKENGKSSGESSDSNKSENKAKYDKWGYITREIDGSWEIY